jgi:hypothetical protein
MLPRRPHWFNFPDKERFLALPPAYQAPVIEKMRFMLDVAALGVVVTFLSVQLMMWRSATGQPLGALRLLPFAGVLLTPLLLLLVLRVQDATERQEKRYREDQAGRGTG